MSRALCGVAAAWMATWGAEGWCNTMVNDGWRSLLAGEPHAGMMASRGVRMWGLRVGSSRYGGAP